MFCYCFFPFYQIKFYDEHLEIYQYMYNTGIGTEVALLYESWAWDLEQCGNYKKADAVFMEAFKRGAQPHDHLKRIHR